MIFLLDTQLLIWTAEQPDRLSPRARATLEDERHGFLFSVVSLWEIAIKRGLGRQQLQTDPRLLRRGLYDNGYDELPVTAEHAIGVAELPSVHQDPFDRMLLSQARAEGVVLLTADARLADYGSPVEFV